jgi:DNA polymerase-3 subunit alpha
LPKVDVPDHIKNNTDDYNKQTLLYTIELCKQHGRWNDDPEYIERFKKEIDVIMNNDTLNFLPYFLLYEDICTYGRSQGIIQNIGRGSAGGCLLSYYLKIIHIDPIKSDLPFERFLSHARIRAGSFPDIDSDFGDRTEIIKYLQDKYGKGFAQICTFSTFKVKNAIKHSMWALYGKNGNDPVVRSVCDIIPDSPQGVDEKDFLYGFTNQEGEYTPGLVEEKPEVQRFFNQYQQVEVMVKKMIGLVRGWSRHASAFVISTLDLSSSRVPTVRMFDKKTNQYIPVTQYDAKMCENSGLVKADILGVTTIQSVSDCIDLIKQRHGHDLLEEENGVPLIYRLPEDKSVYKDFYNKKTDSSFQFNTGLIKGLIQQFAPTAREHLSAMTALARPGALDAPFTNDEISLDDGVSAAQYYMDVRNGKRKLSYLHPDLATCTSNGVFVYQEEVMKFLVDYAGYSLEESDSIRGAIAKKKHEVMMESFERIRKNTAARGWTSEQADVVCDMIQAFARYSFNRSHSRCYAELGYITMYLKHHYKLEWWVSELNNSLDKEDKIRHYITLLGGIVTSPSLANPSKFFKIEGNKIVAPLSVLKRVGEASINELVSKGPFTDIDDYLQRINHTKCNKGHFEALVKGRAADDFMRKDVPYVQAREELLAYYKKKRKCNKFNPDLLDNDPLKIFLLERDTNKTFNKSLIDNEYIVSKLKQFIPSIETTGNKSIPLADYDGVNRDNPKPTPIISNVRAAEALLENNIGDEKIGMIVLFDGSRAKTIKAKKTGKIYNLVEIDLSDGHRYMGAVKWNLEKAFNFPKNSVLYIKGKIKDGWKENISFSIDEIKRII